MADPPADADDDDGGVGPDRASTIATPRWVKVFGVIALVVVVLFVVLLLTGGHGPRRHTLSGAVTGYGPLSGLTDHGEQRP